MNYDFDAVVSRVGTNSIKWDYSEQLTGRKGLLPLWVADMDFPAPPCVLDALTSRVSHGVFGYARVPQSYTSALREWLERRHGWTIDEEWVVPIPGVVPGIRIAASAYTRPGESVVIQPPVYYPFRAVLQRNGRQALENPLRRDGDAYRMDLEHLRGVVDDSTRMVLLCSPHNPVGRVWSERELGELKDICLEKGLILLSDEIHCDIVMPGSRHIPVSKLFPAEHNRCVTLVSATKTFNISGISCAAAVVPDPELRKALRRQLSVDALELPNVLSLAAAEAAYRGGGEWLDQLLSYIHENYRFARELLSRRAPELRVFPLEGTYLMWIDFERLGLGDGEIKRRILDGGVWLDDGPMFGTGGSRFQRVNIACPRSTLETALDKICTAVGK